MGKTTKPVLAFAQNAVTAVDLGVGDAGIEPATISL
ncbi:hypothetical protein WH7805_10014 [Synechococcus sp. WH 7805]|nr:hypothetical protein WH7805_10014 [Synechococcus sp. WH 7805]